MRWTVIATWAMCAAACSDSTADAPDAANVIDAARSIDAPVPCEGCNAVAQTGCQADQKCGAVLDEAFSQASHLGCIADGPAQQGEPCDGPSDVGASDTCAKGGHCYAGVCRPICITGLCDEGSCQSADLVLACGDLSVCLPACDALAQDCAAGPRCYVSGGATACLEIGGAVAVGAACSGVNQCEAGASCIDGVCRRHCSTAGGTDCAAGESCEAIEGIDGLGRCEPR